MLELKNVSKFYYNKGVIASGFSKVNLKLNMGEFVVITGESGSGKSTLLNVISGLDSYEEGEMYIYGKETSHYTEKDFENFRKKYVSNIFQTFNLVNSYTVYQNIELVLLLNGYKKRKIKKKVLELIEKVDLIKFKNTKVSKLSGGQKQRVAIARALAKETPIIIADEPTGNLDSESAKGIIKLLSQIAKDKLVIVVTHNYEQVEEFATRKITMHDGRILEDKVIKKIENKKVNEEDFNFKNIGILNQIRLGIRNTFNIFGKFILLFAVFLFMSVAIVSEYSSFKKQEYLLKTSGYNYIFSNLSQKRLIINKKDKTPFTDEDYSSIEALGNVDYVVKNDLLLDEYVGLVNYENIYLYGNAEDINTFSKQLDVGRLPENENEVIIEGNKDNYYISNMQDEILNSDLYLSYQDTTDEDTKLKVVGIRFNESVSFYGNDMKIYLSGTILDKLKFRINQQYSTVKVLFLDKYYVSGYGNNDVKPNDNVPQGCAYVSYDLTYYNNGYSIINKPIQIEAKNLYYQDTLDLKITKTYTKNNFKSLLGLSKYDEINGAIFINTDDYNTLFNKASYQSSIFVKNEESIDKTKQELDELGYKAIAIKDTLIQEGATQIIQIIRTVVTIALIITLFFISYFIIKIILKSRNVYFSTIRMLGANQKTAKNLLIIELLTVSNLAFLISIIAVIAQYYGLINIQFIQDIVKYLKLRDYILLYIVLTGISYLISLKYAKKLFQKSSIKTYNEEV